MIVRNRRELPQWGEAVPEGGGDRRGLGGDGASFHGPEAGCLTHAMLSGDGAVFGCGRGHDAEEIRLVLDEKEETKCFVASGWFWFWQWPFRWALRALPMRPMIALASTLSSTTRMWLGTMIS